MDHADREEWGSNPRRLEKPRIFRKWGRFLQGKPFERPRFRGGPTASDRDVRRLMNASRARKDSRMLKQDTQSVLVIEDDRDTRANLRDILEMDVYRVDEAGDDRGGTRRTRLVGYLAILLDRSLPDGTAAQLLPELKRLAPKAKVIVVTGHADLAGPIEALRQGLRRLSAQADRPARAPRPSRADRGAPATGGGASRVGAVRPLGARLLDAHIAVLDHRGGILAVNKAWRDFAASNGARDVNVSVGPTTTRSAAGPRARTARRPGSSHPGSETCSPASERPYEQEYPCHSPQRRRWFVGRVTPFLGEGPRRVVVSHVNITERKLAEEALRQTEQRFRLLVQNSSDIITALTADGTVLYQSPSIERILAYRPEDRVGRSILLDPIVHPEDLARKRRSWRTPSRGPGADLGRVPTPPRRRDLADHRGGRSEPDIRPGRRGDRRQLPGHHRTEAGGRAGEAIRAARGDRPDDRRPDSREPERPAARPGEPGDALIGRGRRAASDGTDRPAATGPR